MALLPDLETAEQAYERGWNDAIKRAVEVCQKRADWIEGLGPNNLFHAHAGPIMCKLDIELLTSSQ